MALIIVVLPVQVYLGYLTSNIQVNQTTITTQRVHLMSEILTAIKLIKFYAWEAPFQDQVDEIRAKELHLFKKNLQVKACNMTVVFALPVIVSVTALSVYNSKRDGPLDSSIVFTALSIFNTLRYPLLMLPAAVKSTSGAMLAFRRLNDFLTQSEIEPLEERTAEEGGDTVIEVQDGEFTWDGDDKGPALSGISLKVRRGEVVAIIGDVGSGKSSFIAALLGQIRQSNNGPQLKIYGKSSYVPQEAWLINVNLRENIIFGKELEQERYNTTIKVCALERDLTLLSHGDMTEIGERGSNLSGGQKQRVSLARAVYYKSDIVLMDDPLSAVDQNVGRQIFDQCIRGFLSDRTVVFVTHQLQYLHRCDKIVMLQHGKIAYQGTYNELMSNEPSFSALINTHVSQEKIDDDEIQDYLGKETAREVIALGPTSTQESNYTNRRKKNRRHTLPTNILMGAEGGSTSIIGRKENENLPQGQVPRLHRSLSRSSANSILTSTLRERRSLHMISHVVEDYSNQGIDFSEAVDRNELSVYSLQDVGFVHRSKTRHSVSGVSRRQSSVLSQAFSLGVSTKIDHEGRGSLNSKKIDKSYGTDEDEDENGEVEEGGGTLIGADKSMDELGLADYIKYLLAGSGPLATILLIILFFVAHGSIMRAPMSFFETNSLGRILSAFSKSMFTVDDTLPDACLMFLQYFPLALGSFVMMAAVVGWQNAVTVIGLLLIAIGFVWYGSPADSELKQMDDKNHESNFAMISARTWIAFYLDILSSCMVYSTALFLVIYRYDIHQVSSVAGLALSNAMQMLVFLQWTVRQMGEIQSQISTIGQLDYYGRQIEPEAPAERPDAKPDPSWPQEGRIEFDHLSLKYRMDSPPVLKDVSFTILPQEKVGIVGRTGSGKSTLLVGLLRIVEAFEGAIRIDGIDISKLGLNDLRARVGIIPQEPVLFVGTIRSNLDPFNRSGDNDIWKALDAVHLGDRIRALPLKLESPVVEHGKNYSMGQRQLICIARSLVIGAKIIVLDEATASIDMITDKLLQQTIKQSFADCTVLTIAHRLNTIIESDKVLVMDGGVVAEFGEPYKLLQNPGGIFAELVNHAGEAASKKLIMIAKDAHMDRNRNQAMNVG
ncbi:hypothetical protein BGZ76_009620 [Entomortierella beljakovae]|nr:hypothetical protein BGZ76_009620 [Entomortierella beljakovae]